ncbi:MAG: hypothetical protein JO368_03910, partial [Acidimicrobiales bacterium]|nr:hypothetical protein [Acidimicrobiales bacterium]
MKHGLAGAGTCLLADDERRVRRRLAEWTDDLRPHGAVQEHLVAEAVRASVRLERCRRREEAVVAHQVRHAVADWEKKCHDAAEALGAQAVEPQCTPEQCAAIVQRLRTTANGCAWLLGRCSWWRQELAKDREWNWTLPQARLVLTLADLRAGGTGAQPAALASALESIRSRYFPDSDGRTALREFLAEEIEALETERAHLEREVDGPDREEAPLRALVDVSPEAARVQRYEAAAARQMYQALGLLARRRAEEEPEAPDREEDDAAAVEAGGRPIEATAGAPG